MSLFQGWWWLCCDGYWVLKTITSDLFLHNWRPLVSGSQNTLFQSLFSPALSNSYFFIFSLHLPNQLTSDNIIHPLSLLSHMSYDISNTSYDCTSCSPICCGLTCGFSTWIYSEHTWELHYVSLDPFLSFPVVIAQKPFKNWIWLVFFFFEFLSLIVQMCFCKE